MHWTKPDSEIYTPDAAPPEEALARTTHLAIASHPDDLEIMAAEGILACFGRQDRWFTGVVVTDGAGSARDGIYAHFSDEQMKAVRRFEQKKAAVVGEYSAVVFLDYPSSEVKDPKSPGPVRDLCDILQAAHPHTVYLHNPADKHPTHVATVLRSIQALRTLPQELKPARVVGCEVWRSLDWMEDGDKVVLRLDEHENIAAALVALFDSQITGGKRYDLATLGRRRANATYHESHSVDAAQMINFGMDLTPLIHEPDLSIHDYVMAFVDRFKASVAANLQKYA
ncbi:MAG: PIG-L deacetylase family protein [Chthonomonadales bacterium]